MGWKGGFPHFISWERAEAVSDSHAALQGGARQWPLVISVSSHSHCAHPLYEMMQIRLLNIKHIVSVK